MELRANGNIGRIFGELAHAQDEVIALCSRFLQFTDLGVLLEANGCRGVAGGNTGSDMDSGGG
ncbi:MAG: hypothetical protein ACI9K5_002859, partial [Gammaproteobacteria bacterium]